MKYTNLSISKIYNIKYNRATEYEQFLYVNRHNEISTFNFSFIKRKKPVYKIENSSYQYSDPTFSIEKIDNISLDKSFDGISNNDNNHANKTSNSIITTEKKNNTNNRLFKIQTYHKLNTSIDRNKQLKIISQKNDDNILSSISKSNISYATDDNILDLTKDNKSNIENIIITPSKTDPKKNSNMLNSNNGNSIRRDKNEFLNSINKTTILNIKLTSSQDQKYNNLPQSFDDRGYTYNSNATYFDNDGEFFDENGFDKHKGRHDRFGDYIPGPGFNKEIGMYTDDINNLSFNEEQLKKEIEEKERLEFEKIKLEGKESKKLKKDFQLPIEKDDSSDSFDYQEEFEKLEREEMSNLGLTKKDNLSDLLQKNNLPLKPDNNTSNNDIATRFFNGEFNNSVEENLKFEEDSKININNLVNQINQTSQKEETKVVNSDINTGQELIAYNQLDNIEEDEIEEKRYTKKKRSKINIKHKIRKKNSNDKIPVNKFGKSKSKNKKNNKKAKSKNNSPDNSICDNNKENQNEEGKNTNNKTKIKKPISKTPQITEESINQETNFEDIDAFIMFKNRLKSYNWELADDDEQIQDIANIYLKFVKKKNNNNQKNFK